MGHFWRCLSAEATGLTVETARSSSHLKPSVLSEPRDCPPLYYAKWTPCRTLRQTKATEQCSISSNSVTTRIPDASTLHGTPSFLVLLLTTVEQNFSEVFIKFRLTTVRRQRSPTTADASPSQAPRSSHTPTDPSPQGAVAPRLRQGWGGGEKRAGPPRPHPAWYGRPPPPRDGSLRALPVAPGVKQGPAELRAQLPQRWLRPLQLQRRRSLLQPHAKLHSGGAGGAALPPALRSERAPAG